MGAPADSFVTGMVGERKADADGCGPHYGAVDRRSGICPTLTGDARLSLRRVRPVGHSEPSRNVPLRGESGGSGTT
ncbi:hypothetical protein MTS1_03616 [Microbacterium sp. TS-1]|nr:hypothetical protein MTS1_03616 [Microbacterium sp. TS-1]